MSNPTKLPKYLAIIIYDFIIILGILLLAISMLFLVLLTCGVPYPEPTDIWFRVYIFAVIFSYYHISWAHVTNGQTIGMKAWSVKMVNHNPTGSNHNITAKQSLFRIIGGILSFCSFGVGYLLLYFNKQHKTLADYLSNTQLYNINCK